jgi:hypothetical protein
MSSRLTNEVRIEETQRELQGLAYQIEEWSGVRTRADKLNQYSTQLSHVSGALDGALQTLARRIGSVSPSDPRTRVAAACRAFDHHLMIVRRVWTYFSTKWGQRDEDRYRKVLAAADEVVWSCHADPLRVAADTTGAAGTPPAPLPYIESTDTPTVIPREAAPEELTTEDDRLVGTYLRKLAVPVVSLPPRCVEDPWWLVLLGHEVGHNLQFDLGGWELVQRFREEVEAVVGGDEAREWGRWASELFADACSVCAVGGSAAHAIAAIEVTDDVGMLSRTRPSYPPPAVRIAAMAAMAKALAVSSDAAIDGVDPEALTNGAPIVAKGRDVRAAAAADLAALPRLVRGIYGFDVAGKRTPLPRLFALSVTDDRPGEQFRQSLHTWMRGLLGEVPMIPKPRTDLPRRVIGAGFAAWGRVADIDDRKRRETGRAALSKRLLEVLPQCREEETRAASTSTLPDAASVGEELADALLQAVPEVALP